MPAREGLAMKLFGRTVFFLAVSSLCRCGAQDSATTSTPQPTGLTTSRAILSTTTASATRGAGNTLTTKTTTAAEDSSGSSTSQTTLIPKVSLTTSNGTITRTLTPKPSLLSESNVTATPNSSLSTTGPSGNTTTKSNDTLSLTPNIPQRTADSKPEVKNDTRNSEHIQETNSHFSIIIPVVIALIVITLSVFLLVTVYRMCWKTTPERQENGADQGTSDKENVKLISVKTTSPETGDHSSQGKNKTRQHDDSSLRLGSK